MRYADARFEQFTRDEAYRMYVSRSLQLAPQQGYIEESYYDILHTKQDNRTGDEIALDIIQRAELEFE